MATNLTRVTQQLFGSTAGADQIAQFGSLFAGSGNFTTDPAVMQSLSNWLGGWFSAAVDGNSPAIEDMNAVCTVFAYQLAYVLQKGVPEWDSGTTYFSGNIVSSSGILYVSRTNNNLNNLVTDATNWNVIGGSILSAIGDLLYGGTNGTLTKLTGNSAANTSFLTQTGTGIASAAPAWRVFKGPTVQRFVTGSGTYTPSAGVLWIQVEMVGGGGGGGGSAGTAGNGAPGTASTFGGVLSAGGGGNGGVSGSGATGGTNSITGGIVLVNARGGGGGSAMFQPSSGSTMCSGVGGNSAWGGGGAAVTNGNAGLAGGDNTGAGGSGAALGTGNAGNTGSGGGSGGYVKVIFTTVASSYVYAIGAAGNGGTAGTGFAGGNGGIGQIVITEYYQ